ncbi:hypothetical protein [Longimicrobium terrae]|uniref:BACON domain-containing protein n=1 Tax=Longimicrobium terrae TaxID=1639882 RepID=A0A841GWT1_9BACT|nr:hypothetical protein [Longimicrobium terrae]MBB4635887.1 hypothetical protein [Longimicrobium terrae]MBB6070283.1 hypothetical protein [Longimicrobium terrae]NNC30787.1 hypothetical protein [Longimicrobium terrae]
MSRSRFRAPWFPLLLAVLAACESDGSGPDQRVELSPASAVPFSVVEVRGLPDRYAGTAPLAITVGGQPSVIAFDEAVGVHRFLVPALAPGRAEVVVPAPMAGGAEVRATLQVAPVAYAGGSPATALAEMDALLDSMQVEAGLALGRMDVSLDSVVYARLNAAVMLAETLQDQVQRMTPTQRQEAAALFSAQADAFRGAARLLSEKLTSLAAVPPTIRAGSGRAQASPAPAYALATVPQLIQRCEKRRDDIAMYEEIQLWLFGLGLLANTGTTVFAPEFEPFVFVMTAKLALLLDTILIIENLMPELFEPDGLRLQVSPGRVKEDGGTARATAWLRFRSKGEVIGSAVGLGRGMAAARDAIRQTQEIRGMIRSERMRQALKGAGIDVVVDGILRLIDAGANDYIGSAMGSLGGETQVSFESLSMTPSGSGKWEFTDGPQAISRGLRTVGRIQATSSEDVTFAARAGATEECTAATSGADPGAGQNGFRITLVSSLRFVDPADLELEAGASGSRDVTVTNEATTASGPITFRLAHPRTGAWEPYPWMQVSITGAPSSISAGQSRTVRIAASIHSSAPESQEIVPIVAMQDGRVVAWTYLRVGVRPQLSSVVVNRGQSTLRLWDYGTQDGDIVTVTVNGATVASSLSLTNAGMTIPVEYRRGRNVIVIRAHNEGSLPPNTAAIGLADVVRGDATQEWGLFAGGTAQLTATFDPGATASPGLRVGEPPTATYFRCAGAQGDCRP